jgi:hypothetical protein
MSHCTRPVRLAFLQRFVVQQEECCFEHSAAPSLLILCKSAFLDHHYYSMLYNQVVNSVLEQTTFAIALNFLFSVDAAIYAVSCIFGLSFSCAE